MDWSPLWLSLRVAGWATVFSVLLGLLIALPLSRRRLPGRSVWEALTILPLVLPPTVLGYALLVGLGRASVVGHWYHRCFGHDLAFTWQGAVVAAAIPSLPLFIANARVALASVDPDVVSAARTDGASGWAVFRHILLPLPDPASWPGDPGLRPRPGRLRRDLHVRRGHARRHPDHAARPLRCLAVRRSAYRRRLCPDLRRRSASPSASSPPASPPAIERAGSPPNPQFWGSQKWATRRVAHTKIRRVISTRFMVGEVPSGIGGRALRLSP